MISLKQQDICHILPMVKGPLPILPAAVYLPYRACALAFLPASVPAAASSAEKTDELLWGQGAVRQAAEQVTIVRCVIHSEMLNWHLLRNSTEGPLKPQQVIVQHWQMKWSIFAASATCFPVHCLYIAIFLAPPGWPHHFQTFLLLQGVQLFLFFPEPGLAKKLLNIKASQNIHSLSTFFAFFFTILLPSWFLPLLCLDLCESLTSPSCLTRHGLPHAHLNLWSQTMAKLSICVWRLLMLSGT